MSKAKGFTLIELMVVVSIIGILATVSLAAYLGYVRSAANNACLAEVKGYATSVMVAVDNSMPIPVPPLSACVSTTNAATLAGLSASTVLDAYPVSPGTTGTRCNLQSNTACFLDSSVVGP